MLASARTVAMCSLAACAAFAIAGAANAAVIVYTVSLNGPNEFPPNNSPGIGTALVTIDTVAHTLRVQVEFSGLIGVTTVCHIHAPTTAPFTGNAGVATTTPTFPGFPAGVMAGTYDQTFGTDQPSTYNPSFLVINGGAVAIAEATLFQAMAQGKAYLNIHSNLFGGGEIRGFLKTCYPDCNLSASLTLADFGCFQTAYVSGEPYADCNESGSLTVADFGCFQGKFVAGCP